MVGAQLVLPTTTACRTQSYQFLGQNTQFHSWIDAQLSLTLGQHRSAYLVLHFLVTTLENSLFEESIEECWINMISVLFCKILRRVVRGCSICRLSELEREGACPQSHSFLGYSSFLPNVAKQANFYLLITQIHAWSLHLPSHGRLLPP